MTLPFCGSMCSWSSMWYMLLISPSEESRRSVACLPFLFLSTVLLAEGKQTQIKIGHTITKTAPRPKERSAVPHTAGTSALAYCRIDYCPTTGSSPCYRDSDVGSPPFSASDSSTFKPCLGRHALPLTHTGTIPHGRHASDLEKTHVALGTSRKQVAALQA